MDIDSFLCGYLCMLSFMGCTLPTCVRESAGAICQRKKYFNEMEGKEGWDYVRRSVYNIDKSGKSLHQRLVDLNKNYAYMFCVEIEDSATFYSLPSKIEDTIALHLYNHIIHKSPRLKKIIIIFNYEEDLNERASIGHSRTEEYAVHGKRLVKLKHDTE